MTGLPADRATGRSAARPAAFARYVALGDSSTEGIDDPDGAGGYRGWSQRLAERINAAQGGGLLYANLATRGLTDEVFGPSTLLVRYRDRAELVRLVEGLEGQLTATVHGSAAELPEYADAVRALTAKSGRLVFDQFPTGVDRVAIRGKVWLAYDSSSGTLYRFTKRSSSIVARNVPPLGFTPTADGVAWWNGTSVAQTTFR
jgi:hypothetical protein